MRICAVMFVASGAYIPLTCHISLSSWVPNISVEKFTCCFVFKRFRVWVSLLRTYILKEGFRGCPHPAYSKMYIRHYSRLINPPTVPWLRRLEAGLSRRRHVSTPGRFVWNLWWLYGHWDNLRLEYFHFPLEMSPRQCSIVIFRYCTTETV